MKISEKSTSFEAWWERNYESLGCGYNWEGAARAAWTAASLVERDRCLSICLRVSERNEWADIDNVLYQIEEEIRGE